MAEAAVVHSVHGCLDQSLLNRYTYCAEQLIKKCGELSDIPGATKLERKCVAELKYLRSLSRRRGGYNVTHLRSSNLGHYAGVLHAADNLPHVTHILQAFTCPSRTEALHMDIVAGKGHIWVKVIARKAQALHLIWAGQGQYGEKDIVQQATDFTVCAKVHPVNFEDPKVVFAFYNGVTAPIADRLNKYGVVVLGDVVSIDSQIDRKLSELCVSDSDSDTEGEISSSDDSTDNTSCKEVVTNIMHANTHVKIPDNDLESLNVVASKQLEPYLNCDNGSTRRARECVASDHTSKCDTYDSNEPLTPQSSIGIEWNNELSCDWQTDKYDNEYLETAISSSLSEKIVENKSNSQTQRPLTDLFTVNKYKKYPIDIRVTHPSSKNDCTALTSIDYHVSQISSQKQIIAVQSEIANSVPPKESNLVVTDSDNMSEVVCFPEKQFQSKTDLQNESVKKIDSNIDKWNFGSTAVLSIIQAELLINPILDFSVLGMIVAGNEINTIERIGKVNLDITALITLVSSVSHGGCYFRFREKILSEQAAEERCDPVLPKLQAFLKGKELYTCQSAVDSFHNILDTLGGDREKSLAAELLATINIVPDEPSYRARTLPNTGKIKNRSKIIFGTGDCLRAVTLTANSGFVRAAAHQGVTFAVFLHASRALTEQKEVTADKLTD